MRPKTAGGKPAKKSVGFSLQGTKIEPPEDDYQRSTGTSNKFKNTKEEFFVAKAKEFESFKNLPRFSHAMGAVIHPRPVKKEIHIRQPPKTLQFDGRTENPQPKRYEPKNLPEHLARPIDEAALARVREKEALRLANEKS